MKWGHHLSKEHMERLRQRDTAAHLVLLLEVNKLPKSKAITVINHSKMGRRRGRGQEGTGQGRHERGVQGKTGTVDFKVETLRGTDIR